MSKMSDPIDPAYHLKWFYEHCAAHHYLLDTDTPMLDVALAIMHHIVGGNARANPDARFVR
jgi:hypothetical protein